MPDPDFYRAMIACNRSLTYKGLRRVCDLPNGHAGPCRTWIEEADLENEPRLWSEPDELEARWPK